MPLNTNIVAGAVQVLLSDKNYALCEKAIPKMYFNVGCYGTYSGRFHKDYVVLKGQVVQSPSAEKNFYLVMAI